MSTKIDLSILQRFFEMSNDLLGVADIDSRLLHVSSSFTTILGWSTDELVGASSFDLVHPDDVSRSHQAWDVLRRTGVLVGHESRWLCKDQTYRWIQWNREYSPDDQLVFAVGRDVTEVRGYREQLQALVFEDPVTGVSNRRLFEHDLELAYKKSQRSGARIYVIFLDINDFKSINDQLGHEVGDEVLRSVASRIRSAFREGDVVARLGGDEFVVLVFGQDEIGVIDRMSETLRAPVTTSHGHVNALFGIGYAVFPDDHADDAQALLRQADSAMYVSKRLGKQSGRTIVVRYDPQLVRPTAHLTD